ncbi:hypothetical protein Z945_2292 [Sulfitobacter noctilucae]|nr:hypothetical protein Z945_2292 [Sulfitobacter noctilucae]
MASSLRKAGAGLPHIYQDENDMKDDPRDNSQPEMGQIFVHIIWVMAFW